MRVVVKRIGADNRGLRFELDLPGGGASTGADGQAVPGGDAPTLAQLLNLIAKKTEIPEWAQRVFYQGRYLHGPGSLAEKGVPAEGAVLLLATSAHYREPPAVTEPAAGSPAAFGLAASSGMPSDPPGSAGAFAGWSTQHPGRPEVPAPQSGPASLSPPPPLDSADGDAVASEFSSGDPGSAGHVAASGSSAAAEASGAASSEDLSKLSVAELKQRLRDRGVSFEGCVEKSQLLDLLRNAPPLARPPPPLPQPKMPPPQLPPMMANSAAELLGGNPFGMGAAGNPPGFVSVGMGPFQTGGAFSAGPNNAANLGMFLQQLGMETAMGHGFAEVPVQPARGDMGPPPEPPQHPPDSEATSQPMAMAPPSQPTAAQPQMAQGQQAAGQPTITMSFPAGAPPAQAIGAVMQQLGPQIQNMLGPFAQLFGEQNGSQPPMAGGAPPQPGSEPHGPTTHNV